MGVGTESVHLCGPGPVAAVSSTSIPSYSLIPVRVFSATGHGLHFTQHLVTSSNRRWSVVNCRTSH